MKKALKDMGYAFHTIFHPFDGFWCIQRENRGSTLSGLILLGLLLVTYLLRVQWTGYIFADKKPEDISLLVNIATVLVPFFLWAIANWSLTTLMDGESTIRDIIISLAYAAFPITLFNLPLAIISRICTMDSSDVFLVLKVLPMFWFAFLLFVSIITINQYSAKKALFVVFLTLIVMAIIIFLSILFVNMLGQVYVFLCTIVKELAFRM